MPLGFLDSVMHHFADNYGGSCHVHTRFSVSSLSADAFLGSFPCPQIEHGFEASLTISLPSGIPSRKAAKNRLLRGPICGHEHTVHHSPLPESFY